LIGKGMMREAVQRFKPEPVSLGNQGKRPTTFSLVHFKIIVISRHFRFDVTE
jgi:hypothetical protein